MADKERKRGRRRSPMVEWIAGGLGLVLTLALLGFIGWQAVTQDGQDVPQVELSVERISPAGQGYVAEIVARNRSPRTASGVEIEGALSSGETSSLTLDYIPGGSSVRGGLYFSADPAAGDLRLRAHGYSRP